MITTVLTVLIMLEQRTCYQFHAVVRWYAERKGDAKRYLPSYEKKRTIWKARLEEGEINRLGFHLLPSLWWVNVTCEACGFSSSGKMSDDEWFSSRSSCTLASRDKVHRSPVARFLVSFIRLMSFAYRMLLSDRGRQYLVGLACW